MRSIACVIAALALSASALSGRTGSHANRHSAAGSAKTMDPTLDEEPEQDDFDKIELINEVKQEEQEEEEGAEEEEDGQWPSGPCGGSTDIFSMYRNYESQDKQNNSPLKIAVVGSYADQMFSEFANPDQYTTQNGLLHVNGGLGKSKITELCVDGKRPIYQALDDYLRAQEGNEGPDSGVRFFFVEASKPAWRGGAISRLSKQINRLRGKETAERKTEVTVLAVWPDQHITDPANRMKVMPCTLTFKIKGDKGELEKFIDFASGGGLRDAGAASRSDGKKKFKSCLESKALKTWQAAQTKAMYEEHGLI